MRVRSPPPSQRILYLIIGYQGSYCLALQLIVTRFLTDLHVQPIDAVVEHRFVPLVNTPANGTEPSRGILARLIVSCSDMCHQRSMLRNLTHARPVSYLP